MAGANARHVERGFTLLELMVVVCIVSVLSALLLPMAKRSGQAARASTVANDLRVFATAFTTYAQQNGRYPPEAAVGVMPPVMVDSLAKTSWLRVTPIGGKYNWDYARTHGKVAPRAAISINASGAFTVTTDNAQLLAIDRKIDDGNLATGNFYKGASSLPVYIIER